jgi:hypothetical protein
MTDATTATAPTSESLGQKIINGLQTGLQLVESIGPVAASLGGPAVSSAVNIATEVLGFAQVVVQAVEDGKAVLDATDLATVQAMAASLREKNDALAAQIEAA